MATRRDQPGDKAARRARRALDGALVAALVLATPLGLPALAQEAPAAQAAAGPAVRIRTGGKKIKK